MNRTITGAAVAAALTLAGVSAHAGCADPRTVARQGALHSTPLLMPKSSMGQNEGRWGRAAEQIVGTWQVSYTVEGSPFADALIQWHSDGTEWENINLPTLGGNLCMGEWKAVDDRHVARSHIGWLFTNGVVSGYFTETETDEVSRDGKSYTGYNDQIIYDLNGVKQVEVTGTSTATRF